MSKLVKTIKLNNLQYNPKRDPHAYRRCAGETFRIQAVLDGIGSARVTLANADGARLGEANVALPGTFTQELRFPKPGTRVVTLSAEGDGEKFSQDVRIDVLAAAMNE